MFYFFNFFLLYLSKYIPIVKHIIDVNLVNFEVSVH